MILTETCPEAAHCMIYVVLQMCRINTMQLNVTGRV